MRLAQRPVWALALLLLCSPLAPASAAGDLPSGLGRFNPAGLSDAWKYEGTAFDAWVPSHQGADAVAVLRLHRPNGPYLFTASEEEAQAAVASGFQREGIAFRAPLAGPPVYRFRAPDGSQLFYTLAREEGVQRGWKPEGVAFHALDAGTGGADRMAVARYREEGSSRYLYTAGRETPYRVGAYYFGSFSPSAHSIISGTSRVHGRDHDWWGGVDDFYGAEPGVPADHRGWPGSWPDLKPAIGYYDQTQVATLEQHIAQAADAGLDFFSFYWYWSNRRHGELLPEALASFRAARNRDRLHFNVTLYAHPWDDDMAIQPSNLDAVVSDIVALFGEPQYLRLPDGRPVVSIGDSRNVREADGKKCADADCNQRALTQLIDAVRMRTRQKLGVETFVQIQAGVPAWDRQAGIDGITCLLPPFALAGGTAYPHFDQSEFQPMRVPGRPFSPCMLENFDERPRQDILVTDRAAIRYLSGMTDDLFRHNLLVARAASDDGFQASHDPATRIVYLYAWNEWHEGGIIEPTAHSGAHQLNIVTDAFQLPRSPSTCLDQGACRLP